MGRKNNILINKKECIAFLVVAAIACTSERLGGYYGSVSASTSACNSACSLKGSGAPNDRFLSNAFRRCFRFSGVLSKLYRSILGCAKKYLSVRIF